MSVSVKPAAETAARESARPLPRAAKNTADGAPMPDFAPGLEMAFPHEFRECDYTVEAAGEPLPDFLRGVYYLNGPARFGFDDLEYGHWLDGDGMVCALRFDGSSIRLTNRYVRSRKFVEEQKAGRALFRTFGTSFPGSLLNRVGNGLESPVNVSVYPFAGHLLAFGEQGLPWELDAQTLETRGQFTFHGRLNDASPFSAHPKFDPGTGEMFNFGIFFSAQPRLYFYCFGPEGMRYRTVTPLEYPCSVHDFSISRNYAVFYLSPHIMDSAELQHGQTVMDALQWLPERGSRIMILERKTGDVVMSLPAGNRYCLHLINTFEEDERLTIDVLEFDEPLYGHYEPVPDLFQTVSPGGPVRFILNLQTRELAARTTIDYDKSPDFPAIDPRRSMHFYEDFWMLGISAAGRNGRKFFDQLVHANWRERAASDIYQSPPRRYLGGEPVFAGSPRSDQGVIICQEFDADSLQSSFLLFDAGRVARGPMAKIPLKEILYLGFHAAFKPEVQIFE